LIDEIHELASDERGAQLAVGLERLRDLTGREFQRIGLSATVGTPDEVGAFLAGVDRPLEVIRVRMPRGMRIRVEMPEPGKEDADIAERLRVQAGQATALRRCYEQIKEHQSTLFFVNTRDTAEFLSSRLAAWYQDPGIGVHHGSLSKDVRVQMEDEFKAGRLRALVCTSSLELGIDVGGADFVLQYNSPREVSRLVQRIGRSGHGVGEVSDGVILATHEDDVAEACAIARRAPAGRSAPGTSGSSRRTRSSGRASSCAGRPGGSSNSRRITSSSNRSGRSGTCLAGSARTSRSRSPSPRKWDVCGGTGTWPHTR